MRLTVTFWAASSNGTETCDKGNQQLFRECQWDGPMRPQNLIWNCKWVFVVRAGREWVRRLWRKARVDLSTLGEFAIEAEILFSLSRFPAALLLATAIKSSPFFLCS